MFGDRRTTKPLRRRLKADFLSTQRQCREMKLGENVRTSLPSFLLEGVLRVFSPLC